MVRALTILLVVGLALVSFFSCGKEDTTPVSPNTDVTAFQPGQNARGYFTMSLEPSGGPFSLPEGMAVVDPDDELARIVCGFATDIDTNTLALAFTLERSSGQEAELAFAWEFGPVTTIFLRPGAALQHNTTYILSLTGGQLLNTAGDMLDLDGDHIGGESPDDNLRLRFTTRQEGDTLAGEPVPETDDILPPAIISGLIFLVGGDTVTTAHWMDASVGLYIADYFYNTDGDPELQALNEDIFSSSTVTLRDAETKVSVAGDINYDDNSASPSYYRLTFDPDDILEAGKYYEFVLKAQMLTDENGNKLNETGDIIYTFQTINATHDSSVIIDDITPPAVVSFADNGISFTIGFSEEMDLTTINAGTFYMTHTSEYVSGSFTFGMYERPASPTGFATAVTFRPIDSSITFGAVTIRAVVKDLAGNHMASDYHTNWD